ncbi:MAG: carboxymuconolactone decarboxylase family protein [Patescibacteria group bacterium]|nr:carboxymuconolactone decarboxylase family protein [Patescibacteria group bacterium]
MALISNIEKEQASDIAKAVYENFEECSGSVPEWVKVMAHRPEILKEFVELFGVIMKQGEIEPTLKWKIGLAVSKRLKCRFCVDVTEKMLQKFGANQEVVQDVEETEEEKKILSLVEDITADGHLDNLDLFKDLKEKFNEAEIVEIISVIGLFNYINRFNNTLAILPE